MFGQAIARINKEMESKNWESEERERKSFLRSSLTFTSISGFCKNLSQSLAGRCGKRLSEEAKIGECEEEDGERKLERV